MVTTNTDLYTTDFYAWCLRTAELVRTGQWEAIDPEALAEELEGLAKRDNRELEHRLEVLVLHLLKWAYQPQGHLESHSWYDTIVEQRRQLTLVLRDNPTLRTHVPAILLDAYPSARQRAAVAMGTLGPLLPLAVPWAGERRPLDPQELLRRSLLPMTCPWTPEQVLATDFWPDAPQDGSTTGRH
jgi:Domain of unknown function DUF29